MSVSRQRLDARAGVGLSALQASDAGSHMDTQIDIGEVENFPSVADHARPALAGVGRGKDPTRWRLRLVYLGVALLLAAGTVVAVASHNQLQRTETHLAGTQTTLHRTLSQLVAARKLLATTTGQSAAAKTTLDAESADLAADQKQLATAQGNVYSNGISIGNLDTCLSGVQKALNLISLGNQAGGAAALSAVSSSCQSADPSSP
jgi:uncharacterized protein HemX